MNRTTNSFKTNYSNYGKAIPKENYIDGESFLAGS